MNKKFYEIIYDCIVTGQVSSDRIAKYFKDKELQDIYNKIFKQSVQHMKDYEPQMVAGTLMAIAIRLYRTSLSDDGFSQMLQTILDSEDDIKPYKDKETVH